MPKRARFQAGTWVGCVDEQTAIQAREAEPAPRATTRGHVRRQAPRSKRRGARHLIAGLSVAEGQICGRCSTRTRFVDVQTVSSEVLVREAQRRGVQQVALIVDNGPTHAPTHLERWLAAPSEAHGGGSRFEVHGLPVNASWLDQLEIWFAILQRKLLQPNHVVRGTALEQAIAEFIARSNQAAKPITWTDTVENLEKKRGTHL